MLTQIVGLQQILITVVFLSCLVGLLIFLRMKGGSIRANLQKGQRIIVVEETAVSPAERLRLITIDGLKYVMLTGKGIQPSLAPLSTTAPKAHVSCSTEDGFIATGQVTNQPSYQVAATEQAPLELTTPVLPRVGEQPAEFSSPRNSGSVSMDTQQMKPEEVAAFVEKFKGWRKN